MKRQYDQIQRQRQDDEKTQKNQQPNFPSGRKNYQSDIMQALSRLRKEIKTSHKQLQIVQAKSADKNMQNINKRIKQIQNERVSKLKLNHFKRFTVQNIESQKNSNHLLKVMEKQQQEFNVRKQTFRQKKVNLVGKLKNSSSSSKNSFLYLN